MSLVQRLQILLNADPRQAISAFESLHDAAERNLGAAETRTDKWSTNLTRVGAAAMAVGGMAAAGLWNAAKATSDLAEAANMTENVFGDMAGRIEEFAQSGASNIGLSERAAREATTSFGNLLGNMGLASDATADWSIKLTQVAVDLSSAFNTSTEQAVHAIGAALRGETEPIRQFGVMMDEAALKTKAMELGIYDGTGALDMHTKAQAGLALVMDQTASSRNDFINTLGSAANQNRVLEENMEDLRAKIGEGMLPIMEKSVGTINNVIDAFMRLNDSTNNVAGDVAIAGTGILVFGGAALIAAGQLLKMRTVIEQIKGTRLGSWMAQQKGAMMALTIAIGLGTEAYRAWQRAGQDERDMRAGFTRTMQEFGDSIVGVRMALNGMVEEGRIGSERLLELDTNTTQLATALKGSDEQWWAYIDRLKDAGLTSQEYLLTFQDLREQYQGAVGDLGNLEGATGRAERANEQMAARWTAMAMAADGATVATDEQEDSVRELVSAYEALQSHLESAIGYFFDTKEAQDEVQTSLWALATDSELTSGQVYEHAERIFGAYQEMGLSAEGARDSTIDALSRIADGMAPDSPVRLALQEIIWALQSIDGDFTARVLLDLQTNNPDLLQYMPPSATLNLEAAHERASRPAPSPTAGQRPTRVVTGAAGGVVRRPTWALIGEAGPEAVVPLGSSPGNAPLPTSGGGSVNITLNGSVFSASSVLAMLKEIERRNGAVPIRVSRVA